MSHTKFKKKVKIRSLDDQLPPYFILLAKEKYEVVVDDRKPNVVLTKGEMVSVFGYLAKVRRRYGFDACLVSFTGENVPPSKEADYSFSYLPTDNRNFQYPLCANLRMRFSPQEIEEMDLKINNLKANPKDKFCNFVYRNDALPDTRFRREFCQMLFTYKRVDCPSESLNNMPGKSIGKTPFDKLTFISKYKFTIAFENTSSDYYVTEKISDPLSVGSIPIYWGCPQITEYYNPESFINCHDYDSFEDVVERVKEIDNNSELYERYLNAPQVLPNSRLNDVTREAVRKRVHSIVEDAVSRRGHSPLQKHLSYFWWLLKNLHHYTRHHLLRANKDFWGTIKRFR